MSKILTYLPELEGEEQIYVANMLKALNDEQAQQFSQVYRSRRKDPTITLLTALVGFMGVAGVHRFLLGDVGMGLLYLFTGGLCFVGTIIDIVNYQNLTLRINRGKADEAFTLIRGMLPPGTTPMGNLPPG